MDAAAFDFGVEMFRPLRQAAVNQGGVVSVSACRDGIERFTSVLWMRQRLADISLIGSDTGPDTLISGRRSRRHDRSAPVT